MQSSKQQGLSETRLALDVAPLKGLEASPSVFEAGRTKDSKEKITEIRLVEDGDGWMLLNSGFNNKADSAASSGLGDKIHADKLL